MPIVAVAIVGTMNNPLFLRSYLPEELKFHYIIHASLDLIEDGVSTTSDLYLGMLYPSEEYRVFGYVTSTLVKLIVVVDAEVSDQAMKNFFEKFHTLYCNMACNPFYTIGDPIHSKGFETEMTMLVTSQFF